MDSEAARDLSQWIRRVDERVDQVQKDVGHMREDMAALHQDIGMVRQTTQRLEGNLRTAYSIGFSLIATTLLGPMLAHWLSSLGL